PARSRSSITPGASLAGPSVARMRVRRWCVVTSVSRYWPGNLAQSAGAQAGASGGLALRAAQLERGHRRQLLAFQERQERAAAGGDVADVAGDTVLVHRRQGVAAAGDRERVRLGDRARHGLGALAEGVELEHP